MKLHTVRNASYLGDAFTQRVTFHSFTDVSGRFEDAQGGYALITDPLDRDLIVERSRIVLDGPGGRCGAHRAYDADYCPVCGTATVIGMGR